MHFCLQVTSGTNWFTDIVFVYELFHSRRLSFFLQPFSPLRSFFLPSILFFFFFFVSPGRCRLHQPHTDPGHRFFRSKTLLPFHIKLDWNVSLFFQIWYVPPSVTCIHLQVFFAIWCLQSHFLCASSCSSTYISSNIRLYAWLRWQEQSWNNHRALLYVSSHVFCTGRPILSVLWHLSFRHFHRFSHFDFNSFESSLWHWLQEVKRRKRNFEF